VEQVGSLYSIREWIWDAVVGAGVGGVDRAEVGEAAWDAVRE
jgi:hypothetical protein